ncbi:MAG: DNA polymerase IV [candidate division NC10 bacterium]|jgi:nucleotidyltransferase/DNA polymerase involved in DNA repair
MMRGIIHVDMDAFYAAVEQRDHPAYQRRPVIVGADPKEGKGRGVVAACSYEARAFGVRSAMPISRAYRLCNNGVFLPVRMERYEEVSERIFGIFRRYTDLVEPLSIDEAFLDVTGSTRLFGEPAAIGRRIKAEIRKEEKLTASVGVAPNKFSAKIASDLEKPDGFVVVRPEEVETFLQDLSVVCLWGVGKKTAATLQALGIKTIGELSRWPEAALCRRLGTVGVHLHRLSRGIDDRPVMPEAVAKSIGAETTFSVDLADLRQIRQSLLRLAERVSARLRREDCAGSTTTLKLRFADFTTLTRSLTLAEPVALTEEIYALALSLFHKIPLRGRRVRLLGITVSKLTARISPGQMSLFPADPRRKKAAGAVDEIRRRFGEAGIIRASLLSPTSRETGR